MLCGWINVNLKIKELPQATAKTFRLNPQTRVADVREESGVLLFVNKGDAPKLNTLSQGKLGGSCSGVGWEEGAVL